MIFRKILAVVLLLLLSLLKGNAQVKPIPDIYGRPLLAHVSSKDSVFFADYYTELGDTLKVIPFVKDCVDCSIGRDSLKRKMLEIYYDTYDRYNEYYYHNLRIFIYLLFDKDLNVKEIRLVTHRKEQDLFVLDICDQYFELLKTIKWIRTDNFPETSSYGFATVFFWNSGKYRFGDLLPY